VIVILLGVIIYSNSFQCSFHFDDNRNIVDNASIRNLADIKAWWNFFPTRPVGIFTFAMNYHFSQLNVWPYHLVNLVIHLINSCLAGWLVLLIFSSPAMKDHPLSVYRRGIALFTALLFVSHPLATQSVTYIVQRMASLVALFYFLSLILYVKARLSEKGLTVKVLFFGGSFISAVLALLTKETAFTLPFAILLFEVFFFRTEKIKVNFKDYRLILFLAALLGILVIIPMKLSVNVFKTVAPALGHAYPLTPLNYLFTEFSVIIKYIQLLVVPMDLRVDYDFPVSNSIFQVRTLFSFLGLVTLAVFGVILFRKYRLLSFGIFWFFLTLSVESGIIPITDVIFEHRTYLPSFGYFLVVSTILVGLFWQRQKVVIMVIMVIMVISNSYMTFQRNKVWKDELSLWSDNVIKSPGLARPLCNLGFAYSKLDQWIPAIDNYSKALEIDPNYTDALSNRGAAFAKTGQWDKSIMDCSRAILLDPRYLKAYFNRGGAYTNTGQFDKAIADYTAVIGIDPRFHKAYSDRGIAYAGLGQWEKAIEDCSKAISLDPEYGQAYYNRGIVYANLGQWEKVIPDCSRALELDPSFVKAYLNRGAAYGNTGQLDKAIDDYSSAIRIAPGYSKAYANRAVAYSKTGQWDKAVSDYTYVIRLEPANTGAWYNRGIAYGNLGLWDNAVTDFSKAIEIDPSFTQAYSSRNFAISKSGSLPGNGKK
jgi:protein O-mannosyl-transferase